MPPLPTSAIQALVRQWLDAKKASKMVLAREAGLKEDVKALLPQVGTLDPNNGHVYYELPYEGKMVAIINKRRVQTFMDPDKALALFKQKGLTKKYTAIVVMVTDNDAAYQALRRAGLLEDPAFKIVRAPTEDSLRDAFYAKDISDNEYRSLFTEEVSWALYPPEGL